MKNALCMYGLLGGTLDKRGKGKVVDFEKCFKSIKENILDINNADIFIHSWSVDHKEDILRLYKPLQYIIEPQLHFDYDISKFPLIDGPDKLSNSTWGNLANTSHWYSVMKSVDLKKKYEVNTGSKYRCVMLCRFDIMFFNSILFGELDDNYLYASNYNHKNEEKFNFGPVDGRYEDLWFIGGTEKIDKLSEFYFHHKNYKASPHKSLWKYVSTYEDPKKITKYLFWRGRDYELYRYIGTDRNWHKET